MIRIEQVTELPFKNFASYSEKDFEAAKGLGMPIEKTAEALFLVAEDDVPLLAVGIIRPSLLTRPFVWVLLHENLEKGSVAKHLRSLHSAAIELSMRYGKVTTSVETRWKAGRRFARFFGFKETEHTFIFADRHFTVMEN